MAAAKPLPVFHVTPDYGTWMSDVRQALICMHVNQQQWQERWKFDFRKEFEHGVPARDAAVHAHDFWWRELLRQSWT